MNQVELLLRLSENAQDAGDELAHKHNSERMAHAKELHALYEMIEVARQNIHAEMARWGLAGPKQAQLPETNVAPKLPPAPAFLRGAGEAIKGGNSAPQARVEPRDDQREHPRAASPRQ